MKNKQAYDKAYYLNNRDKKIENARRNSKKRRKERKKFFKNYKQELGCEYHGCCETRPDMLVFHHKDPKQKQFDICNDGYSASWERLEKELAKCEVLCSKHHAERHNYKGEKAVTSKKSHAWKAFERRVAKDLGGERAGPTGKNGPDVIGIPLAPECKYMQKLSLRTEHINQAIRNAGDLPWALFLQEGGTSRRYVVLDYDTFLMFWDYYTKENTNG